GHKMRNHLKGVMLLAVLLAFGTALGEPSTFTVDDSKNATVGADGNGYQLNGTDSSVKYANVVAYNNLLIDGTQCGGLTNTGYTVLVGNDSGPAIVTITNDVKWLRPRHSAIRFKKHGGMIVVSETTPRSVNWSDPVYSAAEISTAVGNARPNMLGTFGFGTDVIVESDVTADSGVLDIFKLLPNGSASLSYVTNQNASVAARILFEGGEMWSLAEGGTKFQVADGAKIILQSVNGNPIVLRSSIYDYKLFSGAGTLETAGDGDFNLMQAYYTAYVVTLSADEGGSIVWGHSGDLVLGGRMYLKVGSDDILPHGSRTGKIKLSNKIGGSEGKPLIIDLNGNEAIVNGFSYDYSSDGYSKHNVITNSSETIATLGFDIWNTESEQRLHELMPAKVKLAVNASSTIKFKKLGAAKLMVGDAQATNVLESVAGTEVADGVLWFGDSYTLTRPLTVTGNGSIQVREDVQGTARTLNLSAIADADLSIGGLTVDTADYYGKTPTITKFRPSANGKLYLTNVSGELASNYTVPINLTTVVDAENFASWKVYVNGAEVRGFVTEYVNGVLKAKFKNGLTIFVR
ncbi:MAG: hypothetical protein II863_18845, partial [Kiritimatiellae bacterium]|nr:hypothetical protein [Kiritimatiellia bacterium]